MQHSLPSSFNGMTCEIIGAGGSGVALARYLSREGAALTVRDRRRPSEQVCAELEALGARLCLGDGYLSGLGGEYIFRAPAVRPGLAQIAEATARGSVLTSEWELFFDRAPCKVIGITGSDGKTTTTTITQMILAELLGGRGAKIYAAGNIGLPLVSLLDRLRPCDITVAELSSFQLMTLGHAPHFSALTNITPNHLDYHADMREYITSKLNIFGAGCTYASLPDTPIAAKLREHLTERSLTAEIRGWSSECDIFCDGHTVRACGESVLAVGDIRLPGRHNIENYMTAISLCRALLRGYDATLLGELSECVRRVATDFSGAAHRMQTVAVKRGVRFVDSSIDTTPSRSATTLGCFSKPLTVICGGYDKALDQLPLARALSEHATAAVVTGAATEKITSAIASLGMPPFELICEPDFESAVRTAAAITPMGGTVLLSPACASFDRFANYTERSALFKKTVLSL